MPVLDRCKDASLWTFSVSLRRHFTGLLNELLLQLTCVLVRVYCADCSGARVPGVWPHCTCSRPLIPSAQWLIIHSRSGLLASIYLHLDRNRFTLIDMRIHRIALQPAIWTQWRSALVQMVAKEPKWLHFVSFHRRLQANTSSLIQASVSVQSGLSGPRNLWSPKLRDLNPEIERVFSTCTVRRCYKEDVAEDVWWPANADKLEPFVNIVKQFAKSVSH